MNRLLKSLAVVFVFSASCLLAHASSLYGQIDFKGGAILGPGQITFNNADDTLSLNGLGSFTGFTAGTSASFTPNFLCHAAAGGGIKLT